MRAVFRVVVGLLSIALLPAASSDGDDKPITHDVSIQGALFASVYVEPYLEIGVGEAVVWHHDGVEPLARHSATADDGSFDTGTFSVGRQSQPVVFDTPGTFTYFCSVHAVTMHGVIVVA